MKLRKLLSIFISAVLVLGVCPIMSVFAFEERVVVSSGICGAEGDNLKWNLYDDGELVISGEGEMDWYVPINGEKLAPWNDYYDNIKVITLEEGVTSIGKDAFRTPVDENGNFKIARYYRINLPLSLEYFESYPNPFDECRPSGNLVAFCYKGNEKQWQKVKPKGFKYTYNKETGETYRTLVKEGFGGDGMSASSPVKENRILYLNGKEPTPFCRIRADKQVSENSQVFTIALNADYYIGDSENAKLEWSLKLSDGKIEPIANEEGIDTAVNISGITKRMGAVTVEIVTEEGKTLASDSMIDFSPISKEQATVFDKIFSTICGFFYEIYLLFGYGLNIISALFVSFFS